MISQSEKRNRYDQDVVDTRKVIEVNYSEELKSVTRIKSGMINSSFLVVFHDKSKSIFRVYKNINKTIEEIKRELELIKLLLDKGIGVPRIILNKKKSQVTIFSVGRQKWKSVMFEFIKGRHLEPADTRLIPEIAEIHSKMHLVLKQKDSGKSTEFINKLLEIIKVEFYVASKELKINQQFDLLFQITKVYSEVVNDINKNKLIVASLPSGCCHLDFDSSNIFTNGKSITGVIDFDDMDRAPFVADIAYSLWWWIYHNKFNMKLSKKYLEAYGKKRKISKKELALLPIFLRVRNFFLLCLFINNQEKQQLFEIKKALQFDSLFK